MSDFDYKAVRKHADMLSLLVDSSASFNSVARELYGKEIDAVVVQRMRNVIADIFNSKINSLFEHENVRLELSGGVISLSMANHIEGALLSVAKEGEGDSNIIKFYTAMLEGRELSQMGLETLTQMFETLIEENLESIKSGELLSPVQH